MLLFLWGEAVETAVFLYNITLYSSLLNNKTPYELVYNKKPIYNYIRIWGLIAYYKDKTQITKLEPRAKKAILISFSNFNSYKLLNPENNKIFWARDVKILENNFIVNKNIQNTNLNNLNNSIIELGQFQINNENRPINRQNS